MGLCIFRSCFAVIERVQVVTRVHVLTIRNRAKNELVYYVAFKLLVTGLRVVSPLDKFFPRWFSYKVQVKSLLQLDEPIFRKNHVIFPAFPRLLRLQTWRSKSLGKNFLMTLKSLIKRTLYLILSWRKSIQGWSHSRALSLRHDFLLHQAEHVDVLLLLVVC